MADEQRVAVVTGASSGIGKEAAKALVAQGWRVIGQGRDPGRSAAATAEIEAAAANGGSFEMVRADLSSLADTARAADEIAGKTDRIDALLCNAGGVQSSFSLTPEGHETTFAANHLGHFLLTTRLLPELRAAAAGKAPGSVRVISVSSSGHEGCPGMHWDDLNLAEGYQTGRAYCQAKLANILFTRGLAKRVAGDGIVAHAMHPGVVDSNFVAHADAGMQSYMKTLDFITPAQGADTLVWLATAEEPGRSSGGYYHARQEIPSSPAAQDAEAAERLWAESEAIVARAVV